jgi:K+-sensing histidine kinase KdpD
MGEQLDGDHTTDEWSRLRRTEQRLRALQETTRELLVATSHEDVADATLSAAREVFDQPIASLWQYDAENDALVRLKHTREATDVLENPPESFPRGEGIAWDVYEDGEVRAYDDLHASDGVYNPDTPLRSELMAPVGEYGIILAASTESASFDEIDRDLGEILAATVESAFERLEREQALQDRQRDLTLLKSLLSRLLRHNFRNKITIIRGQAAAIAEHVTGPIRENARTILQTCDDVATSSRKAQYVERLVDGEQAVVEQQLSAIVDEAIDRTESHPEATIEREVPSGLTVLASEHITRGVVNLLDNALVHGGDTPTVTVTGTAADQYAELVVADDGPGVPQEEIEVFERRAESPLTHSSGMGLWLVDWIVTLSDGEFHLERDEGTRAVIRLPIGS